jgi:predicted nucleotidyltransferase
MDIIAFRDKLVSILEENLVCLIQTGSRVRGEPRADSDYDFALIVSKIDRKILDDIREVLSDYSNVSVFILDKQDLTHFPKAMYLQFVYSKKIFGDCNFPKPSPQDIDTYINRMRRDEIDTFRHYLTLPHDTSKLVSRIALSLKYAYICLTYLIYKETNNLPKTRMETIDYLQKKDSQKLGITLLKILEKWSTQEVLVTKEPREYLHMVEEFWRTLEPKMFTKKPSDKIGSLKYVH